MPAEPTRSNLPGLPTRHNRRRLRTRIVLSFFLLGLGLTSLFALATNYIRDRIENQLIEKTLKREVESLVTQVEQHPDQPKFFLIFDARTWGDDNAYKINPLYRNLSEGVHEVSEYDEKNVPHTWKVAVQRGQSANGKPFTSIVRYDVTGAAESTTKLMRWLFGAVVGFTLLSLAIGWWSASRVMSPVSDLVRLIRRRSGEGANAKALAPRFPNDEVGELARALDDYSDRINDAARREREFNADVSHELRTPLAVIRSTVELMLEQPDLSDKMRERIQRIQRAQEGGTAITETLLLLSRGERVRGETSVARVAEQLLDAHRLQMRRGKQLDLRMEGNTALMVDAPEATVNVALGNLIANAVRYTDAGSVTVHIGADSVDVIDTGRGLSEEDEQRMAERGYRGGASSNTKGAGIGLAIVTRICALYGWQMQVQPRRDGTIGTVATLSFSDVR